MAKIVVRQRDRIIEEKIRHLLVSTPYFLFYLHKFLLARLLSIFEKENALYNYAYEYIEREGAATPKLGIHLDRDRIPPPRF